MCQQSPRSSIAHCEDVEAWNRCMVGAHVRWQLRREQYSVTQGERRTRNGRGAHRVHDRDEDG
jgi:hypothetical protein